MRAEAIADLHRGSASRIDPDRVTEGLSIADQQIIEIAKAISLDAQRADHGRADRRAVSGVEVERLFAVARSLRDEGRALLFISHRFDEVFALCDTVTVMRDGAYIATTPDRRDERRRARAADGRPRRHRPVPEAAGRDRRRRARRRRAHPRGRLPRHHASPCAPARSSGSPASSAPAAARSPARSSASTPTSRAPCTLDGRAAAEGQPARRDGARPRARARGPAQAGTRARRERHPQRHARDPLGSSRRRACSGAAPRTAPPQVWASRLEVKTARARRRDRHAERRQPAEGRARQVARDRAEGAHRRRADPRHRRRHQGRGAPPALRTRQQGIAHPHDLVRAARGARHGRPRARHARGPPHRRVRPRARRHPRPSCSPRPHEQEGAL